MHASVIVPARDAAGTLPDTLAGLREQDFPGTWEIIVVDDASADATARIAEEAGARVIRHARPIGPGASRNAGVAAAHGDVLAFTDADCRPSPSWLAAGVRALRHAGLVQGRVEPTPGVTIGPFDRTLWVSRPWGLFESANLFVRRDVFDHLGGFGNGLIELAGTHFGEDAIFGWEARRAGVTTAFCDTALVHHAVFRRGALDFVRERRRHALFAALAHEIPELHDTFLYRRWFLTPRSAAFALAVVGTVVAVAASRPAVGALAALPWARLVGDDVRAAGALVAAARAAGDGVGLASSIGGSLRARTLVL